MLALRDAAMLEQHQIHAASMWIDRPWTAGSGGWGEVDSLGNFIWDDEGSTGDGFPDPDALISTLNNRYGMELMLWVANRIDFDSSWLDNAPAGIDTFSKSFDMRDPLAVEWVKQSLGTLANRGIRGFKIDRGEEGEHPDSVQNLNTLLFTNAVAESFTDNGINDAYPFARSAYDTARRTSAFGMVTRTRPSAACRFRSKTCFGPRQSTFRHGGRIRAVMSAHRPRNYTPVGWVPRPTVQ